MKILFIVRSTLYNARGGDTIQVEETTRCLSELGVKADIKRTNEKIDYHSYDMLHFFNITRPADMLLHIKKSGKPFVVSTILIDYSLYDKQERKGIAGKLFRVLSPDSIEYVKTVYRGLTGNDSFMSASYLWKGQKRSIKKILAKASCILVQAIEEYNDLVRLYKTDTPFALIRNGVKLSLCADADNLGKEPDLVLCVGRIEGIKNQYNLIRALNNTGYRLLLIGAPAPNQKGYYDQCKKIAGDNISFIGYTPQEKLFEYYARAKVHALPSWYEVCGLSSLEAAAMGCRVVITGNGYAHSYFNDEAFYCDPAEPSSIRKAVNEAMLSNSNGVLQKKIQDEFTWEKTALETLVVYKKYIQ